METDLIKIFASNFKRLRTSKNLLQKDIAEKLGVSTSIVSDWEKGVKLPRAGALEKLAELFDVQKNELFAEYGATFTTFSESVNIPIFGRISCGNGLIAYEDIEGYEVTPKEWLNGGEYFYLRATGDSMIGARIYPGDLLLIRKQDDVENGEIAAVIINGEEAVLKRVFKKNGTIILQSENPKYEPILSSPNEVIIIGKLKMNVIKY